jgi:hypothetical protein
MINRNLSPPLPYLMDLETGISFPRDRIAPASRDAIRRRAYWLWESEGRPAGHGLANWLDAESELQSDATARVRDIPSTPIEASPGQGWPHSPAIPEVGGATIRKADGPSPLCREAMGDDIRDYAFHLYIQSGCAPAQQDESWQEARLCFAARLPPREPTTSTPKPTSMSRRVVK